ncbi:MAG: lysyl oxidase family protein [Solirubrobacterales bacterium]
MSQPLSRVRLAIAVALVCGAALGLAIASSPPASAGGAATLRPDLVTLAIEQKDMMIERSAGETLLRLSNEVANAGPGPLEVFPSPASANCDGDGDPANDRDAAQRLFADSDASGSYDPGVDAVAEERGVGCMRYHPAHDHWHVVDFASYELHRERTGKLTANRRKVGFCIVDSRQAFAIPGSPAKPAYPFGPPGSVGCDAAATQGLSPGWADVYVFALPGQQIDVSNVRRGRFCLVSRVDPADRLLEANENNNVRRVRIALRPKKLIVRRLAGKCRT